MHILIFILICFWKNGKKMMTWPLMWSRGFARVVWLCCMLRGGGGGEEGTRSQFVFHLWMWLVSTVTKSQKQNTSCLLKKNQDYTNCITAPTRDATKSNTWNNKKHIPRVWINHKSATKLKIHSGNLLSVQTYIEIPTSLWKDQLSDYVLTFFFFFLDRWLCTHVNPQSMYYSFHI